MALSQKQKTEILACVFGADTIYQIPPGLDRGQGEMMHWSALDPQGSTGRPWIDLGHIGTTGEPALGQSTTLDRSNYRSLIRDYPDVFTPVQFPYSAVLGAYITDLDMATIGLLAGLMEDCPVYDEPDLAELAREEEYPLPEDSQLPDLTAACPGPRRAIRRVCALRALGPVRGRYSKT
jgi:hypothetical protein